MAYYYYYQPMRTSPDSLLPGTTTTQFTPPPLLLLSSSPEQYLSLPLCTPVLPSATTSMSMPTTAVVTEHHQQQLPTPNTFIKHCEDMGLFKDLQNVVIKSGPSGDTAATSASITSSVSTVVTVPTPTIQPTTSNLCISSSTAAVKTMMMANPFDETFKQAVLQQQKADTNPSRNIFNNNDNNDGELNTPFIVPTTVEDMSTNSNLSTVASTVDMRTTAECMTTTHPQPERQNMFITTSKAETTGAIGGVLVTMKPQQCNSIVSMQRQHQQNNRIVEQQFVLPSTTTTTAGVVDTTTMICHDKRDGRNTHNTAVNVEAVIKQALKQNLLVKQMLRKRQKQPLVSEKLHEHGQLHQQNENVVDAIVDTGNNSAYNDNENQLRKQLKSQEKLERNRSAAKRCRMKRKQRWQLLSEENRKLKVENVQLRIALRKLLNEQSRWTSQQQQVQLQGETTQNACVDGTDD